MIKLRELRKEKKLKQQEIFKDLRITKSTYSNWENELFQMDYENLKKISDYFDVSIDYLLDHKNNNLDLSPTEKQLIINFRKLSTEKQKALLTTSTIN